MPLKVLPAGKADMYRAAVIERHAYAPLKTNDILFPGPLLADSLKYRAGDLEKEVEEPNVFWFKVVDTDIEGDESEQTISVAKWTVYDQNHPVKPKSPRSLPPGSNAEACELLFGTIDKLQPKHIGGRPHIFFGILATEAKHQGRGAASLLLKKCIEEAEAKRLPIYLDSSEMGHPVYLKHGFRDLEEVATDFSKWGLEKPHLLWAMIKEQ
ncbi:hypothetical protein M406DRAFT_281853 [Cryphonectria parasitica EP155]|uniref:N-acetyltransferase domain-containing protein n=1 Tax=Cryphonectria parasitica (strain ATCC 38755 / EP155) TaxID=660469 RepID=A0A9P4XVK4_CRYP1|nr:uncharacterized protein M406DRAFT_281853 [Cryphonectria parasitica EP155]KAF3761774.1 hypothetical protein M406DRAFT_281853 [Cryphonectria parasitica EP155]